MTWNPGFILSHFNHRQSHHEHTCPRNIYETARELSFERYNRRRGWEVGVDPFSLPGAHSESTCRVGFCEEFMSWTACRSQDHLDGRFQETENGKSTHEADKQKVIVLIRNRENCEDGSIALDRRSIHAASSRKPPLNCRRSLGARYIYDLQRQHIDRDWGQSDKILALILPYAESIALHCHNDIQRVLVPRGFMHDAVYRRLYDDEMIEWRLIPLATTRRGLERQFRNHSSRTSSCNQEHDDLYHCFTSVLDKIREAEAVLEELYSEYRQRMQLSSSETISELMHEQKEETRESKKTAIRVGRLTTLATVFLPLSVTTSLLGMKLQIFASGSIQLGTFTILAVLAYGLAALPFFRDILLFIVDDRVLQAIELSKYSVWAAMTFGSFCLCHSKKTNDHLWGSGLSYDMNTFKGIGTRPSRGDEPANTRERNRLRSALKRRRFSPFSGFWRKRVEDLFVFIDTPGWEKSGGLRHWKMYFYAQRGEDASHLA